VHLEMIANTKDVKNKQEQGQIKYQAEDMDTQGGSAPDDLSFHLENGKFRRKPM